jgi:hypothetical protein
MRIQSMNFLHHGAYLAGMTLLLGAPDPALSLEIDEVQIHGFLSQGFTYTSGNNLFGTSRNGSLEFTELGINATVRPLPNLLLSAQGLYRQAGGSDEEGLRLDYAQLDYNVPLGAAGTVGVRLGRVKIPFGLYNQTRDVIWTRPSILLPQSVYFDTLGLRGLLTADGGLVSGRYVLGDHAVSAEFLVSEPLDDTGGAGFFVTEIPNAQGDLSGRPMLLGRATYEWRGGRGRLMFSVLDLDRDFESSSPQVPSGNFMAFYPLLSGQYNAERLTLTAEYGRVETERSGFVPGGRTQKNTSEGYYLQGEYRFAPGWSGLLRYDVFYANIDDRSGRERAALTSLPRHHFFAKDLTLGLRWEFTRNWLVAAEYHHVYGTALLSPRDNPDLLSGGGDPEWDLFALMVSYRF